MANFMSPVTFNAGSTISVCEATALQLTYTGLPTTGIDQFQLNFAINGVAFSHTTPPGGTGLTGSYTFITTYIATVANNGQIINPTVCQQDPLGSPTNLGASGTHTLNVYGIGSASLNGTGSVPICDGDTYTVQLNVIAGVWCCYHRSF